MSGERTYGRESAEALKAKQMLEKAEAKEKVFDIEINDQPLPEEVQLTHSTHADTIDPLAAVWGFDESTLEERHLETTLTRILIYLAICLAVWQCIVSFYIN